MLTFDSVEALLRDGPGSVATSPPMAVTQATIDAFAELTHDPQWIHVDVERAKTESPFGTTIAHGFLTLSLLSAMIGRSISMPKVKNSINYGFNKIRFVAPVPAGSEIVGTFELAEISQGEGYLAIVWEVEVRLRSSGATVLAAQWLSRVYP